MSTGPRLVKRIPIDKIDPPPAPLRLEPSDEEIKALARSIKTLGLINPITVREKGDRYEIIAGHRRFLAAKEAKLKEIDATVIQEDEQFDVALQLAENVARRDLSPIEEAAVLQEMKDTYKWGIKNIAKLVGKSPHWVKERLDLLEMKPDIQLLLHTKQISIEHAKLLDKIEDDQARARYTQEVIDNKISVKTLRMWVDMYLAQEQADEAYPGEAEPPKVDDIIYTHLIKCQICLQGFEPPETRTLILCRDCYEQIMRALHGGMGNATHADPGGRAGRAGVSD
ncbi:MAG: hypothetical protein DRI93_03250 [Aquificota bacterium]|nr:MAG: hypothetical protein DRJ03_14785 [Chloroflexota bacterium]RLD94923.1 MAG: hypothetical protein DRI93_03250 [Aquificota bacterium]